MTLTRTTQKVTYNVQNVTIYKDSNDNGLVKIALDTINDNSNLDTQVFDAVGKITLTFTDENTGETFRYFVKNSINKPELSLNEIEESHAQYPTANIKHKIESFIDRHHAYFNYEHSIDEIKTLYEKETGEQLSKSYLGKLITDSGRLHKRRLRNTGYKTKTWFYSNHDYKGHVRETRPVKNEDLNDISAINDISEGVLSEMLEQPLDTDELELLELLNEETGGLKAKHKKHSKK